jgi:hypothetical protein
MHQAPVLLSGYMMHQLFLLFLSPENGFALAQSRAKVESNTEKRGRASIQYVVENRMAKLGL